MPATSISKAEKFLHFTKISNTLIKKAKFSWPVNRQAANEILPLASGKSKKLQNNVQFQH
jgi:hypothetical protein